MLNTKKWHDYNATMQEIGLSQHALQLEKRKRKYPFHIKNENGVHYISEVLSVVLAVYVRSKKELELLRNEKGGSNG
jgi:hypothetical protein